MEKKLIHKNDIYLIGALLIFLLLIVVFLFFTGESGKEVVVSVDGREVQTFLLSENVTYEIEGVDGGRNLLVIENGEAFLKEASCPDHLCINMGRIRKIGQSIICLPNKVTVEIRGKKESDDGIDAIVG